MATEGGPPTSQPTMVLANGVELCVQTFGDLASPAILLIGGAASSMDWWEDGFCERLASGHVRDPLFPYGHAEALAAEIPSARLLPLEGMGHEMPPRPVWDQVVAAILDHTAER